MSTATPVLPPPPPPVPDDSVIENQDIPALCRQQLLAHPLPGLPEIGRLVTPRTTSEIPSSRIGIGFETLDRHMFDPERVYPHLEKLGAKWARVQTGWSRCETTPGVYDFAWLDTIVDRLRTIGVQPFFSVSFGNKLYMPDVPHESAVGYVPLYYGDAVRDAWTSYTRALAAHFRGRVAHWEIWNEPNIPQFWHPSKPDARAYAELVRITAAAIREQIPDATIIGGAMSKLEPAYLETALHAGMADHIDVFSFHPYQTVPEQNLQNMHDLIRRLLDRHSPARRIAIWQGENGCPSQTAGHNDDWLGLYDMDQIVQAKWIARRLLIDLRIGFDLLLYFHAVDLMDRPYRQAGGKVNRPVMMGLIHGKRYTPKYSFEVMRRICSLFDNDTHRRELYTRFAEPDPQHPQHSGLMASPVAATFTRHGAPLVAYWNTEDAQQKTAAREIDLVLWHDSDLRLEKPVLLDFLTGTIHDAAARAENFVLDNAVIGRRFRLPLPDYPLLLTDASVLSSE
ncbi:GH39 family glycosyl hydrolase [Geminisphaera colitermitum]|uniref:GH39 family glycosyl hydrolase n=1 Tax=Geminisphaera colitermitum TaxID=1148786 RepID=UPI000158D844|nr:beta-glucosidase [Geminisphaera colitermitum]